MRGPSGGRQPGEGHPQAGRAAAACGASITRRRGAAAWVPARWRGSAQRVAGCRAGLFERASRRGARADLGRRARADDPRRAGRVAGGGQGNEDGPAALRAASGSAGLRPGGMASRLRSASRRGARLPGRARRRMDTLTTGRTGCAAASVPPRPQPESMVPVRTTCATASSARCSCSKAGRSLRSRARRGTPRR